MSAKEDLMKKAQSLRDQLAAVQDSLNAIIAGEYKCQPGDVVREKGQTFTISSVRANARGTLYIFGKKTLMSGSLGITEYRLHAPELISKGGRK